MAAAEPVEYAISVTTEDGNQDLVVIWDAENKKGRVKDKEGWCVEVQSPDDGEYHFVITDDDGNQPTSLSVWRFRRGADLSPVLPGAVVIVSHPRWTDGGQPLLNETNWADQATHPDENRQEPGAPAKGENDLYDSSDEGDDNTLRRAVSMESQELNDEFHDCHDHIEEVIGMVEEQRGNQSLPEYEETLRDNPVALALYKELCKIGIELTSTKKKLSGALQRLDKHKTKCRRLETSADQVTPTERADPAVTTVEPCP